MMNITSEGNRTLIRWAIFPDGSAKFISNTTALVILYLAPLLEATSSVFDLWSTRITRSVILRRALFLG